MPHHSCHDLFDFHRPLQAALLENSIGSFYTTITLTTITIKPILQSSEPYFPFLGAHAPPAGYRPEGDEEGVVRCCCVCYTFLRQQWEQYDRENKPHSQRFYWMKRLDGKPFIGECLVDKIKGLPIPWLPSRKR